MIGLDYLDGTGYTTKYIFDKLYENNPKFVQKLDGSQVVKIRADEISEGKGNFSLIFKTTVYFDKHDETYTFILKIPTIDKWSDLNPDFTEAQLEQHKHNVIKMHGAECDAYDLIRNLKGFPVPEVYYFESRTTERVIIMEDLSKTGASLSIFFSVTHEHCFNLARHIADFQAYVDLLPNKPWKGKFIDNNVHSKPEIEKIWKNFMQKVINSNEDVELAKKCEFFMDIDTVKLGKYSTETRAAKIGCTTLVHGDMSINNMLIKLNDDASVSNQILGIIDWATLFEGNPLFDIARFITNCADAEVRREYERKIVDFYFDHLTKKYAEHGKKPNFTREEVIYMGDSQNAHELYDLSFIQETLLAFVIYGMMAIPLTKSENSADRAKAKKIAIRLHLLFDDALEIMEKRGLKDHFRFDKS